MLPGKDYKSILLYSKRSASDVKDVGYVNGESFGRWSRWSPTFPMGAKNSTREKVA
jgi:hypothetical protein